MLSFARRHVERSARADDASASQTTSEEYAAFEQVSDSRYRASIAPRKRFAEGSTENVIWRSLNVIRCCYPRPSVVTVIGVIPDNSVVEMTFVCSRIYVFI